MITREEYEFLKKLKTEGFVWIARDKNGKLFIYQEMPRRYRTIWNFGGGAVNIREEHFTFIKWEDEAPTLIADLINEYEAHQELKQQHSKVVIPQFIANWIDERKGFYTLLSLFIPQDMPEDVCKWIAHDNENCEKMARAWLDGYEIEEEKKYYVVDNNGFTLLRKEGDKVCHTTGHIIDNLRIEDRTEFQLTEREIKDYDERYWQFAEEVER